MSKDSKLEDFKKDYSKLQKKYKFPKFEEMNQDFGIERICDNETDYQLREIRKYIADKIVNYIRFVENIIHPVNAPLFIFSIIKSINEEDKQKLTEIYKELAKLEVRIIELDAEFSEEKDAKFINDSFKIWNNVKKDIMQIMEEIRKNWDNKFEVKGNSYFN